MHLCVSPTAPLRDANFYTHNLSVRPNPFGYVTQISLGNFLKENIFKRCGGHVSGDASKCDERPLPINAFLIILYTVPHKMKMSIF